MEGDGGFEGEVRVVGGFDGAIAVGGEGSSGGQFEWEVMEVVVGLMEQLEWIALRVVLGQ